MAEIKENHNEVMLMDILANQVQQFSECTEEQALLFVCTFMDKLKKEKIKIE